MILIKSFKVLCLPIFEFQNNLNISFFLFEKSAQAIVSQDKFFSPKSEFSNILSVLIINYV